MYVNQLYNSEGGKNTGHEKILVFDVNIATLKYAHTCTFFSKSAQHRQIFSNFITNFKVNPLTEFHANFESLFRNIPV